MDETPFQMVRFPGIIHVFGLKNKKTWYNTSMIKDKVAMTIEDRNLIEAGDHIVVGVSGGPDSVCLLHILHGLSKEHDFRLTAVHVNHRLRGEEADRDQAYTEALCKRLGILCVVFSCDIKAMAQDEGMTTEEAGREFRYRSFFEVRENIIVTNGHIKSVKIAVAQNRNDRAETVLMRILRGTGPDGLAAMDFIREDGVIRPLLSIDRSEIEAYCAEQKLAPRIDPTNLESLYTRNRIRLELIPYLEKNYNGEVLSALDRLSRIASEDRAFFREEVYRLLKETGFESTGRLSQEFYRNLPPSLGKRLVAKILKRKGLHQDIASAHLERADRMIRSGASGDRLEFPKGFLLALSGEDVVFPTSTEEVPQPFYYNLRIDGTTFLPNLGAEIGTRILPAGEVPTTLCNDKFSVCIAYSERLKTEGNLVVRSRRPGDWFSPMGMGGTKKLQNFFVDEKIPKQERDRIPLLCAGSEVLWIPGHRLSESCRVTTDTKTVLTVEYKQTV
jgi:tRNA(Ile)-lysidine synthase